MNMEAKERVGFTLQNSILILGNHKCNATIMWRKPVYVIAWVNQRGLGYVLKPT